MKIRLSTIEQVKEFAQISSKFNGDIYINQLNIHASASSIMELFSLNLLEELDMQIASGTAEDIDELCNQLQELGVII